MANPGYSAADFERLAWPLLRENLREDMGNKIYQ
jgi:hypothetical protein